MYYPRCDLQRGPGGGEELTSGRRGQGSHEVRVDLAEFGDTCAVLPVGEKAYVTTRGLKWDLGPDSCTFAAPSAPRPPRSPLATYRCIPHERRDERVVVKSPAERKRWSSRD